MRNFTKMILTACLITGFAFGLNAQSVGINSTGGAPIGSSVALLISLAVGYGGKKVYDFKKQKPVG